jgi:flagellar hook assembly protein FlgD
MATIEIDPGTFSPDNDGRDDILNIQYKVDEPGYVANIIVFDAAGRAVRNLVRNDVLGNTGGWKWDGLGEKKQALPIGIYIIYTELFNLRGKKKQFKNVVVLARKLN